MTTQQRPVSRRVTPQTERADATASAVAAPTLRTLPPIARPDGAIAAVAQRLVEAPVDVRQWNTLVLFVVCLLD